MSEISTEFRQQLDEMVQPLRDQLRAVDENIEMKARELADMRSARNEMMRVLKVVDPSFRHPNRPKRVVHQGAGKVAQDKLDALADWLRQHKSEEAFSGAEIANTESFDLMSRATVSNAVLMLADRGVLRLDHQGKGGARYYRLVNSGG
jgi:hypothetical protein